MSLSLSTSTSFPATMFTVMNVVRNDADGEDDTIDPRNILRSLGGRKEKTAAENLLHVSSLPFTLVTDAQ